MTERKTRSRLTGGIVAVIVLAVCLVVTTVALAYSMISVRPPAASVSTSTMASR